jgi:hypothetical protein
MTATQVEPVCTVCGIPADAGYFDSSSIVEAPNATTPDVVLASFELHPLYCGVLQYFAQFTDAHAADPSNARTPEVEWQIRSDGQPLAPWLKFSHIINPWGMNGFPIHVRLREGCLLEFVARFVPTAGGSIPLLLTPKLVGGRLLGRYWYNRAFGGY